LNSLQDALAGILSFPQDPPQIDRILVRTIKGLRMAPSGTPLNHVRDEANRVSGLGFGRSLSTLSANRAQSLSGYLRRDITLRSAQEFETNHELSDACRSQQRREKMCVEVPLGMRQSVRGLLVKTHRIRKRRFEQVVVAYG
jgi:hypothetical protein